MNLFGNFSPLCAAAAAAIFFSAKGLASSGGPGFDRSAYPKVVKEVCLISHLNRKKKSLICKTDSLAGSSIVLAGAARDATTCA